LWLTGDGRSLPLVVPVDDLPAVPHRLTLRGLADLHETLTEDLDVAHLAMALCRPGNAVVTAEDDAWAEGLHTVLDDAVASSWSLHLAAGGRWSPVVDSLTWRAADG
jgi:hypothetical protein